MPQGDGHALLQVARTRLQAAGVVDAGRDARILFLHALKYATGQPVARHQLDAYLSRPVSAAVAQVFTEAVAAREQRQPVSQIIGHRAFWAHDFLITPDVLDPRPETETLIEAALQLPWRSVLDLGTGSGAILLSLLAARSGAVGTGTDISPAALAVARQNADRIGVTARFLESDWYDAVQGRFDLIVSNPPYIALKEMPDLAPELTRWEPRIALTDEGDGLGAYRAICAKASQHLHPGGRLMVEIGWKQATSVKGYMAQAGLADITVIHDLDGRDRVVCGRFSPE